MGKCVICKKNEAVIFTTRLENDKHITEGVCLCCALRTGLGGMDRFFEQVGINEDNVDSVQEMMNSMVEGIDGDNPLEIFHRIAEQIPEEHREHMEESLRKMLEDGSLQTTLPGFEQNGEEENPAQPGLHPVSEEELREMLRQNGFLPEQDAAEEPAAPADGEEAAPAESEGAGEGSEEGDKGGEGSKEPGPGDKSEGKKTPAKQGPEKPAGESRRPERPSMPQSQEESAKRGSGNPLEDFFQRIQGIFVADEQTIKGLQPVSRGGDSDEEEEGNARGQKGAKKKRKFLDQFGTNLTQEAREGKLDRMIGREQELERVVQILNRRNKNNPVLLGEPGVGKTALAEGLAVRIASGDVPPKLRKMEVYLIDMTGMVAGTQFRGQFESRMKGLVDEAGADGNIILVIDELHNIMGAGDAEGAMNAANILKPALAKGKIRVLGSTTIGEYRRFIEKDSALERRFQQVLLEEPNQADTLEILRGVRDYYQQHHHVIYTDDVLETAVRYADRYIHDRFFPDKAIDLIDEAGSKSNLNQKELVVAEQLKKELEDLTAEEEQLERDIARQTDHEPNELYEKRAKLQAKRLQKQEELDALAPKLKPVTLQREDIAAVVELWTGIPVRAITEAENERLLHLEERLHQRVIGQEEAVTALSRAVRRSRSGFAKKSKPASFLFVGPTGVGKTELVKALAEVLFDDENALVRMDMSEFMEAHTVSKLIGSPPGYVGYDDGGQLTEKIRRHPYSVILLDEIEKAHADVYNILLQILDDGRLTDSHGRVVSFANTVIIMTSNAGTSLGGSAIGFGHTEETARETKVEKALREIFRPEFLNRIDEVIIFHSLKQEELRQICDLMLKEVRESLGRLNISLEVSQEAIDFLVKEGYSPKFGARPLRRTLRQYLEDTFADAFLRGELRDVKKVRVSLDAAAAEVDKSKALCFTYVREGEEEK